MSERIYFLAGRFFGAALGRFAFFSEGDGTRNKARMASSNFISRGRRTGFAAGTIPTFGHQEAGFKPIVLRINLPPKMLTEARRTTENVLLTSQAATCKKEQAKALS